MNHAPPARLLGAALLAMAIAAHAQSTDPLPPETVLVGVPGAPAATEQRFTISTAEDLVVTLTDLQVPAALSSASVVVTQAGSIVGDASLASPATSATFPITGAIGQYVLRVFGEPNASFSVGTYTVCVAPKSSPANCIQSASLAGNISAAAASSHPTVSTLSLTLTVTAAGSYTFTFADDQFPKPLAVAPSLALFQGSQQIALGITSGTALSLSPGTYTLLAVAEADATSQAGLYEISIAAPGGGAPLLSNTYPVGSLAPASEPNNPSAQTLTLTIKDLAFPTALSSALVLASSGATVLGQTSSGSAATPATFAAPAGAVQIWAYAAAGSGAGTYEVDLTSPGGSLLESAGAASTASSLAFAYVTSPVAAGSYQVAATDFQFPSVLPTLEFAVAQQGAIIQQAASASTLNITAAAGPLVILAAATPPATGNGLFDVDVQSGNTLVFDQTQAVSPSDLFATQTINLGASGNYTVSMSDLGFPAQFQSLDLVASSGGVILGKIIGGGSFPISATPGTYQLTFIATPASMQQYGMYSLSIANAAPTVTLSASPTSVTAGAASTLSWTSSNATSCTGTGTGFTGSQSVGSGSLSVSVEATTTFTLTCVGAGGSAAQSVTVTATAAPSHSGGGQLDGPLLGLLTLSLLIRLKRQTGARLGAVGMNLTRRTRKARHLS